MEESCESGEQFSFPLSWLSARPGQLWPSRRCPWQPSTPARFTRTRLPQARSISSITTAETARLSIHCRFRGRGHSAASRAVQCKAPITRGRAPAIRQITDPPPARCRPPSPAAARAARAARCPVPPASAPAARCPPCAAPALWTPGGARARPSVHRSLPGSRERRHACAAPDRPGG